MCSRTHEQQAHRPRLLRLSRDACRAADRTPWRFPANLPALHGGHEQHHALEVKPLLLEQVADDLPPCSRHPPQNLTQSWARVRIAGNALPIARC
jgi:hypothetical protein